MSFCCIKDKKGCACLLCEANNVMPFFFINSHKDREKLAREYVEYVYANASRLTEVEPDRLVWLIHDNIIDLSQLECSSKDFMPWHKK